MMTMSSRTSSGSARRSDPMRAQPRSGQLNQAFILIVAVVVIVATVALSARLLGLFERTACSASDAGFSEEFARLLDQNSAYGSRNEPDVLTPCDADALYLIDAAVFQDPALLQSAATGDAAIDAMLRGGVRTNIFVIVDGVAQEAGFDGRIIIARGPADPIARPFLRIDEHRGRFTLRTEGFGRAVRVDAP